MAVISVQEDGGGDFTGMAAALADAGTGAGDEINAEGLWDDPDTDECTVADANLTITALTTSKHVGRPHAGAETTYRLWTTGSNHTFTVSAVGLTIDGLDIQNTSTGSSDEVIRWQPGGDSTITLKNSLLGFASRNSEQDILYVDQAYNLTINAENCMFYNAYRAGFDLVNNVAKTVIVNINSCSGYDIGYSATAGTRSGLVGMRMSTSTDSIKHINCFNTFVHINTGSPFNGNLVDTGSSSVSADRSITNAAAWCVQVENFTDGDNTESATFAEAGGAAAVIIIEKDDSPFDLRLVDDGDNLAQDAHADANMDNEVGAQAISIPATDLIATNRPQNTNYDIGAFEIVSGAPPGRTTYNPRGEAHGEQQGMMLGMTYYGLGIGRG